MRALLAFLFACLLPVQALAASHGGFVQIPGAGWGPPGPSASWLANPTVYSCVRNFYVATTGNDSTGTGAQGSPWATVQHADTTALQAGDCINVAAGSYSFTSPFNPTHGGNSASLTGYITYRCQTLNGCLVTYTGAAGDNGVWYATVPYLVIDGWDLNGGATGAYGGLAKSCITSSIADTTGSSHHLWIINNRLHDCQLSCIGTSDGEWHHAIHNEMFNCGWNNGFQGSGIGIVIPKVLGTGVTQYPVYNAYTAQDGSYSPYRFLITYNYIHDNGCTTCLGSNVALTTTCNTHSNLTLDGCASTGTTVSFTGSITTTTLTTTTSVTLVAGQVLTGATATALTQGTVVTVGGTGTSFTVNNSQTAGSQAMTAATIAKLELVTGPVGGSCIQPFTYVNTIVSGTITLTRPATCTQTGISTTFQTLNNGHTDGNGIIIDTFCPAAIPATCYPYPTLVAFNDVQFNGARGIHVFISSYVIIANNSTYNNCLDIIFQGLCANLSESDGINNQWYSNIAYAYDTVNPYCGGGTCNYALGAGGMHEAGTAWFNNLLFGSGTAGATVLFDADTSLFIPANNKVSVDPLYVNETSLVKGDPHLQAGSPALGYIFPFKPVLPLVNHAGAYQ